MTTNAYLVTPTGLTAFVNGAQYAIPTDHPNFGRIVAAVQSSQWTEALELLDIRTAVRKFISTDRAFALTNDQISLNGESFSAPVTDKVLELIEDGNAPAPLFAFLRKVRENPSKTAQDELLLFCVANGFMINVDGDIVAYKSVRDNLSDIHSGTITNTVGKTIQMPRHQVDDNRDRTCSYGLHFASYEYASTWAGRDKLRLLALAVNPKNVVSIPSDYDNQKGRTSEYTVIAELPGFGQLPKKAVYAPADFNRTESVAQLNKYEATRDRKATMVDDIDNEIRECEERIDEIENLGGDASDVAEEVDRKGEVQLRLENEIDDLNVKIDVLRAELGE